MSRKKEAVIASPDHDIFRCPDEGCELNYEHIHEDYYPDVQDVGNEVYYSNDEEDPFYVNHRGVFYKPDNIKKDNDGNLVSLDLIDRDSNILHIYIDNNGEICEVVELAEKKWTKRRKTIFAVGAAAVATVILSASFAGFNTDSSAASPNVSETVAADIAVSPSPTPVSEASIIPTLAPEASTAPTPAPEASILPAPAEVAPSPPPPQVPFVVCSYNTHYENDKAISEIMALLTKCDLLGVQELTRNKEALLAQAQLQPAGEFDAHVPLEPNTETATFSKKARFGLEGAETIKLHDQPLLDAYFPKQKDPNNIEIDNATRKNDESNIRQKTMSIMKIIDNTNNKKYAFISLHTIYGIQNNGLLETKEKDRMKIYNYEKQRILAEIAELESQGYRVIPVGDTNLHPGYSNPDSLDDMLAARGYVNSFNPSVPNQTPNENNTHDKTKRNIDHVFAPATGFVITYRWTDEGKWESDHDPVGAGLVPNP